MGVWGLPSGLSGRGWGLSPAEPPNPCSLTPPQIIFEGVRGSGYLGDIAIDDVTLKKGECPRKQMDPNKGARWGGGREGGEESGGAVWVGACLCQGVQSDWVMSVSGEGVCVWGFRVTG